MSADLQCAALNKNGARCQRRACEATEWWRCAKHSDWYDHATAAERERLALLELEEYFR